MDRYVKKINLMAISFFLFITLFCYADDIIYNIDRHDSNVGLTSDDQFIFIDTFFSLKIAFDSKTYDFERRFYSEEIEIFISNRLRYYLAYVFIPQFTARNIHFCQTEFYTGFIDYASDQLNEIVAKMDGLINFHITRLEIHEEPAARERRLQRLEEPGS